MSRAAWVAGCVYWLWLGPLASPRVEADALGDRTRFTPVDSPGAFRSAHDTLVTDSRSANNALPEPDPAPSADDSDFMESVPPESAAFAKETKDIVQQLPPFVRHYEGVATNEVRDRLTAERNHRALVGEKIQNTWFAALVSTGADDRYRIQARFETWKGFIDFLVERDALVEVWTYPEGLTGIARRISAVELARLKRERWEQPTFITATFRGRSSGEVVTYRVEFGFEAAATALAASRGYAHHRELQLAAREILGARDARGKLSAFSQWQALADAVDEGRVSIEEMPVRPAGERDLFVAFEYQVDEFNNFARVVRVYRESEIEKHIEFGKAGQGTQILRLKPGGTGKVREATGYRRREASDELEPASNPIPGQDFVELRIRDPAEPAIRRWNVVEFGEPELLRETALAKFSLINAFLEKRRKELAIKKSNFDLIAEPVFAGLNIAGGLAGLGVPAGEGARLFYDLTVGVKFIPQVPTVAEMRMLFELLAAKANHIELKSRPMNLLNEADLEELHRSVGRLTPDQIQAFLESMSDDDLEGMLRLARMQHIDAKVTTFLAIVANASQVTAVSRSTLLRGIFSNPYFSVTGEISLKNLIAAAAGAQAAVNGNGLSLKQLAEGQGPASAWLQYLNVTVDIRAVMNTFSRLSHASLADKELKQPFPYAPRMSDLAAYEIRIFGFPLLMFYKRGLLKDDYRAFSNDYAYGAIGTRIVEHFQTRELMDEQVRAGRMFPLGYVRVPDGRGGWKDTTLAVFAHRIATGKHRGKTAMVLYGLKAYEEHSQLIEREYERFKSFERALEQGAVIERLVDAEDRGQIKSVEFEPQLRFGPESEDEIYSTLLGELLELRRHRLRRAWGAAVSAGDTADLAGLRQRLTARGVKVAENSDDPLLDLDRKYYSSFRYLKQVNGKWRAVELTLIPSRAAVRQAVEKGEEQQRIEQLRQEAVSPQGQGIILLNEARLVEGRYEIGPLIRNQSNEVFGAGIRAGAQAVRELIDQINQLPVAERVGFALNQFAATLLELEVPGGGVRRVFATFEFPSDFKMERSDPLTGEEEVHVYSNGRQIRTVTDRRLVEFIHDDEGTERRSRTYENRGSRRAPERGLLLGETRTLDVWFRKLEVPGSDPSVPLLRKLNVNFVTGQMTCDTFGLFSGAVSSVDDLHVTEARFDRYGRLAAATTRFNAQADGDSKPTRLEKLLDPRPGRTRFEFVAKDDAPQSNGVDRAAPRSLRRSVERHDLIKRVSKVLTFDHANYGRLSAESYLDRLGPEQAFPVVVDYEYRDDFFFGLVPYRSVKRNAGTGALFSVVSTTRFDPTTRRLTGNEIDYTGKASLKTWDYRWENRVEDESELRRTTFAYDLEETSVIGRTISKTSAEELSRFDGRFDPADGKWRINRQVWHQPGVLSRRETDTRSAFGKLVSTRLGAEFENQLVYDDDGMEVAREVRQFDPTTGRLGSLIRREDDYHWRGGKRDVRVQSMVEGTPYDHFRAISDEEGRVVIDGIRELPGLDLRTEVDYDGAMERRREVRVIQNNRPRVSSRFLPAVPRSDGTYLIEEAVAPFWGLSYTNSYRADDLSGRPLVTIYENGESLKVTEWFPGTSVPKTSELRDRRGRLSARVERHLRAGEENGLPYDLEQRFRISPWGDAGLAQEKAVIQGTGVAMFEELADERLHFDLRQPYESPRYRQRSGGRGGFPVTVDGVLRPHVTAVAWSEFTVAPEVVRPGEQNERVQRLEWVDLQGLFFHRVIRQTIDAAGNTLGEEAGSLPNLGAPHYTDQMLFDAAQHAGPTTLSRYHFDPGTMVDLADGENGGRVLVFTNATVSNGGEGYLVNDGTWRERPTRIDSLKVSAHLPGEPSARTNYLFRLVDQPRERSRNTHLPGQTNAWTIWAVTEFGPDGSTLLDSELTYDAAGNLSATRSDKTTSWGGRGTKVAYQIPRPSPEALRDISRTPGRRTVALDVGGRQDFSASDFIYLYVTGVVNPTLLITDRPGREANVVRTPGQLNEVAFWSIDGANVQWLPDAGMPRQGVVVSAPASLLKSNEVVAVSVHDLARAGLDVRKLTEFKLSMQENESHRPQASPVFRLERGGGWIPDDSSGRFSYSARDHSSGIRVLLKEQVNRTEPERIVGLKLDSVVEFNSHPIALGLTRAARETYPLVMMLDDSDPERPLPYYSMSPLDGRFQERFQNLESGNLFTYTAATGFEVPRLEMRRARVLDDEIGAGVLAYGRETPVTVPLARGRNPVSRTFAREQNRIAANAFTLAGDRFFGTGVEVRDAHRILDEFNRSAAPGVAEEVQSIGSLPSLALVLLPATTVPWDQSPPSVTDGVVMDQDSRRLLRGKLIAAAAYGARAYPKTGLTPTSPATIAEPYVETVSEADLIMLDVRAGEFELARELLEFYRMKSAGGLQKLHSSYDARSGAPQAFDPLSRRPLHSPRRAEAQVAMAEAALQLGFASDDADVVALGANLMTLTLAEFRAAGPAPRGILGVALPETTRFCSLTFWPRPATFSLRVNARAYLVLKQLARNEAIGRRLVPEADWATLMAAQRELEDWLRRHILPVAESTGVVPSGLFEVQNIDQKRTALAVERWTSAEDWLWFIEAADQMGVPREATRRWLEHLARLHGVWIHGVWGLDWSIALSRSDVISTDLTGKFLRVAGRLEHERAAAFAAHQLSSMRTNGVWPNLLTATDSADALATGQGAWVHADPDPTVRWSYPRVFKELLDEPAPKAGVTPRGAAISMPARSGKERTDYTVFLLITGAFYSSMLAVAVFWWRLRSARQQWQAGRDGGVGEASLVPDRVLRFAEERWSKRVLGVRTPAAAERTRFANGPVEANFHMQLRAIHKLVLEWRRRENGWSEDEERLAEDANDDWLNGLDEFCSMAGLYMRWVIKAGRKDGFRKEEVLAENEDSNHIWSRLVMYFSEYHRGLLTLLNKVKPGETDHQRRDVNAQIVLLLNAMGMRQRTTAFDAREKFDFPANPSALDLLIIQQPGMTLAALVNEMASRLEIPGRHIARFIKKYKDFKRQENPYPIHPYLIEVARLLPHFLLMGFGALVYYNYHTVGDQPLVPYLWEEVIARFVFAPDFRLCGLLLVAALVLSVTARVVRIYRWEAAMISRVKPAFPLDKTLTGLFTTTSLVLPLIRPGWRWNPAWYDRAAWLLRAIGFFWLGVLLLNFETPGFTTFLLVKGLLAALAFAESAAIVAPVAMSWLSKLLQDLATGRGATTGIIQWLNQLNITATRPASLLWQSLRYHFRPSVLSGDFRGMLQAVLVYFVLSAAFFFAGGILCQEMFPLWFTEQYRVAANWKLAAGAVIFWITMYLLRFGLFVFITGVAAWLSAFPIKGIAGLAGLAYLGVVSVNPAFLIPPHGSVLTRPVWLIAIPALGLMFFEDRLLEWLGRLRPGKRERERRAEFDRVSGARPATLGVVYMSGDDLSAQKLTPDLLMTRWELLRNKYASEGLCLMEGMVNHPDDGTLRKWFGLLQAAEQKAGVTLWHPTQLWVAGETGRFPEESGLNILAGSPEEREELLAAWHLRRWLVTMMSTAGHSQDTGVNLVDIALRIEREGWSANTVFYLIQNKYDNSENNRPSQCSYDTGELGQRNKLARLLSEVAPGARAYSIQNWTPFGFKAGGLTGTDLIYEESLNLATVLLLDRNATVHDLDALMEDVGRALADPNVVVVIPGRSTTNTRTFVGQGSQMVEEGHRSFLKGLMSLLGGNAGESLGTGWGNILRVFYGPVQRALVNPEAAGMPLTSRLRRGASFALKLEGLIGFGPHAVGISEDVWAVSQATHNAIALGLRPRFLLSHAIWHKIRETWSHSEWLSSFPRWSGGYLQLMHDPIMQQVNEFGPLSVFAKEVRANGGRFYLTALLTLLSIMLMPLAIILDVTPFVEILIVLWNFGFVMNQILTVHGLQAYLENSGFHRLPAVGGAVVAGGLSMAMAGLRPVAPALVVLGFVTGGFAAGLGRWWSTRLRDVMLFGPQLVLHALGQFVRQSLEFTVSGASPEDAKSVNMAYRCAAGPREDRPAERFANLLNLRTVVWGVGFVSFVLNIVAVAGLDVLNVLMLLPSLLFSVSALAGPFLMSPVVGKDAGIRFVAARVLGWLGTIAFYVVVSWLISQGGRKMWTGGLLVSGLVAYLLYRAGRYAGYGSRLARVSKALASLLAAATENSSVKDRLRQRIPQLAIQDASKVGALLEQEGIPATNQTAILRLVKERLGPLLRQPVLESQTAGMSGGRFRSEFERSSVLALLILFWFFLVPVPGLFVLSAGEHRVAVQFGTVLTIVSGLVALAVLGSCLGRIFSWVDREKAGAAGLAQRTVKAFHAVQLLLRTRGRLTDQETSSAFALFTDVQTYIDQRSHAYARRSLGLIDRILNRKSS